jgi:membrane-bound lytic murein transglycosylase B
MRRPRHGSTLRPAIAMLFCVAMVTGSREASAADASRTRSAAKPAIRAKAPLPPSYGQRADVLAYIDDVVAREHLDRDELLRVFADARYSETAARLMSPSAATAARRDWTVYRARFVEPVRLAAGYRFWEDNADVLARAEREFGVPAEIIVGILGCETVYGRNTGSFRVIDALTTLSFDYPRGDADRGRDRSPFFREQLTDALMMSRDGTIDLATLRGSYAGAIGMPQFMPGSIRRFAIDYDGDGRIDLVGSAADVIGSVANFLAQHGWVRDLPSYVALSHPAAVDEAQAARIEALVNAGSEPNVDFAALVDAGFVANAPPPAARFALIDLPAGSDARGLPRTSYLAGTQNFHVITRYNRSYFYALSVIELGATIKALRDARAD